MTRRRPYYGNKPRVRLSILTDDARRGLLQAYGWSQAKKYLTLEQALAVVNHEPSSQRAQAIAQEAVRVGGGKYGRLP